jgi:hypothetical protein
MKRGGRPASRWRAPLVGLGLLVLAAAAAAAAALPALAQDSKPSEKVRFSVEHDLAGFEAAQFSDYADLYALADYKEQDGKELTREEFDALAAKWKAERARVAQQIEQLKTDPALRSTRRLHKKLANHPFLSRLELVENLSFAPVLIVVQRPPKAKPGFDAAVAQLHGPWLKRAVDLFEEDWKEVLPPRREGCALLPVLFLQSYGDFVNYCKTASGGAYNGSAHYSTDLQAVVCYSEQMGGTRDEAVERRAALYALVHSLIQSHAPNNDDTTSQWWLREGLARLYSNWRGDAKAPQVAVADEYGIPWLGGVVTNENRRDLLFMPVQQLLAVRSANDLYNSMEARLGDRDVADADWGGLVRGAFSVECGLVVSDLIHGDQGRQRQAVAARLAAITATTKGAPPPGLDPGLLQKRLAATLQGELKRLKSPAQIDDALAGTLASWKPAKAEANAPPKVDAASDVSRRASGLSGGGDDGPFDPGSLVAEPLPVEARLGIVLRLAGIGELDAAAASCDDLAKALDASDAMHDRVARESQRLHELAKWRRDFVEAWKTGGQKLRIEHDGSSSGGTVKAIEENDLVLVDARGRDLRVALAGLDCEQILRRSGEAKLEIGTPPVRAYAALIAGRKAWSKGLAGASQEEKDLKSDAARWPLTLAIGDAAARLQKLAHTPVPSTVAKAAAPLADLRALFASKEAASVVEPRRALLRRFAAACLQPEFDAAGVAALGLKGRVLSKPDGLVRLTYTFDDAAQAEDWVPADPSIWGSKQISRNKTPSNQFASRVEKGALRIFGTRLFLSKLQFKAPMSVTYKYKACAPTGDAEVNVVTLCVTLCDDGRRSRITATDMGGIRVDDMATRQDDEDYDPTAWDYDLVNENRVVHDGKNVVFTLAGGGKEHKVPAGARQFGRVGIFCTTETWVEIDDLEIEGHVDEASLAPARSAWIAERVDALEKGEAKPQGRGEKGSKSGN